MLKKLRQSPGQRGKVKTVTLLLGIYFSALVAMVTFTGFFVYTNLSVPFSSVAAASVVVKSNDITTTGEAQDKEKLKKPQSLQSRNEAPLKTAKIH